MEKKDFHFLDQDIVNVYKETLENSEIQAEAVESSNNIIEQEDKDLEYIKEQDEKAQEDQGINSFENTNYDNDHDDYDLDR